MYNVPVYYKSMFDDILNKDQCFVFHCFLLSSMNYLSESTNGGQIAQLLKKQINSSITGGQLDLSFSDKLVLTEKGLDKNMILVAYIIESIRKFENKNFTLLVNDVNDVGGLMEKCFSMYCKGKLIKIKRMDQSNVEYIFVSKQNSSEPSRKINTIKMIDRTKKYKLDDKNGVVLSVDLLTKGQESLINYLEASTNNRKNGVLHLAISEVDLTCEANRQFLTNASFDVGFSGLAKRFITNSNKLETIVMNMSTCSNINHVGVCSPLAPCYWSFCSSNKEFYFDEYKALIIETGNKLKNI